jgi:small-conductance mechanosensitive channel
LCRRYAQRLTISVLLAKVSPPPSLSGLQFHNVVGGLFLAFNSQFKIDDFIEVGTAQGFVHRVSLRYTTVVTPEGTQMFVPNSFFLYKPMVNFSQRPKRAIDIRVRVSPATAVSTLRDCVAKFETMLQSLHMGLTSHEENQSDLRHGEKWERFFFVAMEDLFEIRVYSYTDELDDRKYAMICSEVWLALMEIMEELGVEVLNDLSGSEEETAMRGSAAYTTGRNLPQQDELEAPIANEMNVLIGANGARTAL